MKDALLAAARALDGGRWEEAREHLRSAPLVRCDLSQRLVAVALWKRILVSSQNSIPAGEGGETALLALNEFRAAAQNAAYVWRMYQAIPVLIERIAAVDAAAVVATTVWVISSWRAGNRAFPARPGDILARRGHPGQFRRAAMGSFCQLTILGRLDD